MKLDNHQLMEEFYERVRDQYPNLSYEQLKEVCFGPWRFLKQEMESGELPTVRFKYFGTFSALPGRVKILRRDLEERLKVGHINKDQYNRIKNTLDKYLSKHESK